MRSARFDVVGRMPRIRTPLLVIHGDRDSIVPLAQGRRVFEAANDPKAFYLVAGADHNDIDVVGGRAYVTRVMEFVRRVTPE